MDIYRMDGTRVGDFMATSSRRSDGSLIPWHRRYRLNIIAELLMLLILGAVGTLIFFATRN